MSSVNGSSTNQFETIGLSRISKVSEQGLVKDSVSTDTDTINLIKEVHADSFYSTQGKARLKVDMEALSNAMYLYAERMSNGDKTKLQGDDGDSVQVQVQKSGDTTEIFVGLMDDHTGWESRSRDRYSSIMFKIKDGKLTNSYILKDKLDEYTELVDEQRYDKIFSKTKVSKKSQGSENKQLTILQHAFIFTAVASENKSRFNIGEKYTLTYGNKQKSLEAITKAMALLIKQTNPQFVLNLDTSVGKYIKNNTSLKNIINDQGLIITDEGKISRKPKVASVTTSGKAVSVNHKAVAEKPKAAPAQGTTAFEVQEQITTVLKHHPELIDEVARIITGEFSSNDISLLKNTVQKYAGDAFNPEAFTDFINKVIKETNKEKGAYFAKASSSLAATLEGTKYSSQSTYVTDLNTALDALDKALKEQDPAAVSALFKLNVSELNELQRFANPGAKDAIALESLHHSRSPNLVKKLESIKNGLGIDLVEIITENSSETNYVQLLPNIFQAFNRRQNTLNESGTKVITLADIKENSGRFDLALATNFKIHDLKQALTENPALAAENNDRFHRYFKEPTPGFHSDGYRDIQRQKTLAILASRTKDIFNSNNPDTIAQNIIALVTKKEGNKDGLSPEEAPFLYQRDLEGRFVQRTTISINEQGDMVDLVNALTSNITMKDSKYILSKDLNDLFEDIKGIERPTALLRSIIRTKEKEGRKGLPNESEKKQFKQKIRNIIKNQINNYNEEKAKGNFNSDKYKAAQKFIEKLQNNSSLNSYITEKSSPDFVSAEVLANSIRNFQLNAKVFMETKLATNDEYGLNGNDFINSSGIVNFSKHNCNVWDPMNNAYILRPTPKAERAMAPVQRTWTSSTSFYSTRSSSYNYNSLFDPLFTHWTAEPRVTSSAFEHNHNIYVS